MIILINQRKKFNWIYSQSWLRISWWITCIMQWLSISSRKTCNFLWHAVRLLLKNGQWIWNKSWWCKKTIPNLGKKTNYVLHYRNIQLYLSLGMKLTKIHIVIKFKQSDWMKKYINFNTEKRTNAVNSFEKYFFKLMINFVYGKTMENLWKRMSD